MRSVYFQLLLALILSGLNLFSSVMAFDKDRYKEERPTLFLNAGMLFKDYEDIEGGLSEKGARFLTSVMDSEKFNVVLTDPQVSYNVRLPISLNGSPYYDAIRNQLPSDSNIKNLMIYSNLVSSNFPKVKEVGSSSNTLIKNSSNYDIDSVFYELVDLYHNPSEEGFSKGGKNPLKNNQNLLQLLFELGVDAFSEGFDFDSLKPVVSFKSSPPTCVVSTVILDLETCLEYIETEYRWVNEAAKECGVFEIGATRSLKKVHSYLCEPQYIIDFEQYVQTKILSPCEGSLGCLESFLNEEAGDLVNTFHKILLNEKVSNLREKVHTDKDFKYAAEIDKIMSDLNDFRYLCDTKLQEKFLEKYFKKNPNDFGLYNQSIDLARRALSNNLGDLLNNDQITDVISKGQSSFNKCLRDELEYYDSSINFESNGVQKNFENFLKFCESNRFFEALVDVGNKLTDDESLTKKILQNLQGICPNELMAFNDDSLERRIKSFNFEYDAARCFSELSRKINEGGLITQVPLLNSFLLLIGANDLTYKDLGKKYYDICMKEVGADNDTCLKEALLKAKSEILYKNSVDRGIKSTNEELIIERSPNAMNLFVERAAHDTAIWDCFEQSTSNSSAVANCRELATKHLEQQKYKMRRGDKYLDTEEMATAAMHDDLTDMVTELDREISVFHWGENGVLNGFSNDEPAPLNSIRANNYLRLRRSMFHTGPFWDALVPGSNNGTNAGRGLYAAVDPNSTNRFGDTLFEIRLPEGSRYLDLREKGSQGGIPLSRDTIKKLAETGCDLSHEYGSSREGEYVQSSHAERIHIEKSAFEKEGRCHQIFSKVISDLEVNFLSYGYGMDLPSFCDQAKQKGAAFVMIDIDFSGRTTQYNRLTIQEAIKANKEKGTPIPEEVKRIMQVVRHPFKGHAEVNPNTSETEIINYWKERIFLCDGLNSEVLGE